MSRDISDWILLGFFAFAIIMTLASLQPSCRVEIMSTPAAETK